MARKKKKGIASAIDLAGRDVLQAVQMSVNPKVIETPVVPAVANNGIEVKTKARVTVRANIDRLVGGDGEDTVIAMVGEGIITIIGSITCMYISTIVIGKFFQLPSA